MYDPWMLVWLDESGHDCRNNTRKQAYSFRGMPLADYRILAGGISDSYNVLEGIHDWLSY